MNLSQLMTLLNGSQAQDVDDENIAKNKTIKFKTTENDKLLVYGFIHKFCSLFIPNGIAKLILDFYLKLLSINDYNNIQNKTLIWPYNTKSDVDLYVNAKHNDVITSSEFSINGCIFYFECTPKGWGRWQNVATVWCALKDLPEYLSKIKVYFHLKCEEIGFEGEETKVLTPIKAAISGGVWSIAPPKMIKSENFNGLDAFTFECVVKIIELYDKSGNPVVSTKQRLKKMIIEQSHSNDKKTKLEIIKQLQTELYQLQKDEEQVLENKNDIMNDLSNIIMKMDTFHQRYDKIKLNDKEVMKEYFEKAKLCANRFVETVEKIETCEYDTEDV